MLLPVIAREARQSAPSYEAGLLRRKGSSQ
jgi:hypothetical protein